MEAFEQLVRDARKAFDTADHLTYVTYPLIKESKLMITITEHIHHAVMNAMQALLEYEKMYKRISYIPNDFMSRMEMLRQSIFPRYKMQEYSQLIMELREIVETRKKSSMEFARRDRYFIYADEYRRSSSVSIEILKGYLVRTRGFLENVGRVIGKNERTTR